MAENPSPTPVPSIAALPPTTARQMGSGQVLVDPSSLVKELIDNALDARAKSIFVDITANTIDSIQVKDDGHGIPAEDRALLCRRYCTSKIRDFYDLKEVGGKWLGFRGEALSSMAEMSGTLAVTTRVEGEPVAVKLNTERDSHPVGTTVKVTQFFEYIPVRRQTATKNAAKCLAKIRRLVQAYALARPAVRFRLHVLKAKNNKGDFIYAPKTDSNIEDAILKVISKDCALQCDWTALESDGFEVHAFLPKPTANESKIANYGAFISIDSRPVSNSRGTIKQVVAAVKERLRKSSQSLTAVKDPFFCMNIICPPDSYDPNIEPAKDDVMFEDGKVVLDVVDKLLRSYYPEAMETEVEPPTPGQQHAQSEFKQIQDPMPNPVYLEPTTELVGKSKLDQQSKDPRWRSSMYGIDEDDLEHLQEDQPMVIEEEEGRRAADIPNPWTIARMNSIIKPKVSTTIDQLLSPVKGSSDVTMPPSSPSVAQTPLRKAQPEPLTPQTSSRLSPASLLDSELGNSMGRFPQFNPEDETMKVSHNKNIVTGYAGFQSGLPLSEQTGAEQSNDFPGARQPRGRQFPLQVTSAATRGRQRKPTQNDEVEGPDDTWFGQPMRGSQPSQPTGRQKRRGEQGPSLFASNMTSSPGRPILAATERISDGRLYSEDNADIRSFFGQRENGRADSGGRPAKGPSLTPINAQPTTASLISRNVRDPFRPLTIRERSSSQPIFSRVSPIGPRVTRNESRIHAEDATSARCCNEGEQFEAYDEDRFQSPMPRPSSAGSDRPPLMPIRSNEVRTALDVYSNDKPTHNSRDMTAYFKAYQDRENAPANRSTSSVHRQGPRVAPPQKLMSKTRRQRRRTTDAAQRTKSSKLLLERVPHGYHIQDIVLTMHSSVTCIIQHSRKLDMRCNSLDYTFSAEDAFDAFAEPVSERKIVAWVMELDATLDRHFERLPGADVRSVLHEAIQRGLDARKVEGNMDVDRAPAQMMDVVQEADTNDRGTVDPGHHVVALPDAAADEPSTVGSVANESSATHSTSLKAENEGMSDFDMSQFVDFDIDAVENDAGPSKNAGKEFGEDVEDDMLLDL
ncbi:hypothetical protein HBH70_120210 [Parastagonospora nodorum]|nr:hypothetical protein HBH70_120210 [Parastagonospora nodorum]KAH5281533.1 hypothetical protein HBI71_006520 [Parastagonospora nodorum]KAH5497864.1 hypothetical protein HBI31_092670 [Parastagonospora nodorum]KAH6035122.1 hypothetical protein HBI83_003000 [Parastagonospora nodorum]KAH6051607.1 hypothetical protein HBI54_038820 [Parastagonospora nodorum]